MTTTKEETFTAESFEAKMKVDAAGYGAGKLGAVPIGGGYCYFRAPTAEEWDEMTMLGEDGPTAKRIAYYRMIDKCFLGAFIKGAGSVPFDTVKNLEGPGFMNSAAGDCVNQLGGAGKRPTRFL